MAIIKYENWLQMAFFRAWHQHILQSREHLAEQYRKASERMQKRNKDKKACVLTVLKEHMAKKIQKKSKLKKALELNRKFFIRNQCKLCFSAIKEHNQKKRKRQRAMLMANKYFSDLSKIKMFEALKFYVFHERRNKKMAKYRSMLNWAKNTKLKTLLCLKANGQIRKEKKIKMAKAFSDRDRMIK